MPPLSLGSARPVQAQGQVLAARLGGSGTGLPLSVWAGDARRWGTPVGANHTAVGCAVLPVWCGVVWWQCPAVSWEVLSAFIQASPPPPPPRCSLRDGSDTPLPAGLSRPTPSPTTSQGLLASARVCVSAGPSAHVEVWHLQASEQVSLEGPPSSLHWTP